MLSLILLRFFELQQHHPIGTKQGFAFANQTQTTFANMQKNNHTKVMTLYAASNSFFLLSLNNKTVVFGIVECHSSWEGAMGTIHKTGQKLAQYLSAPRKAKAEPATSAPDVLQACLKEGDVLLIAGNSRFSTAIKYLTQSSWSHATLYIGEQLDPASTGTAARVLVEADINDGIRVLPLSEYYGNHTRICRPVGLSDDKINQLCQFALERVGQRYDLKNIIDLARYLIPIPFVPTHWRRRLLALGSGDPTRAICSSLIAQAFQSVKYPILPEISQEQSTDPNCIRCYRETLHIRHHSLFTPRDFDVSPYFQIIKPTIEKGFDPSSLIWRN